MAARPSTRREQGRSGGFSLVQALILLGLAALVAALLLPLGSTLLSRQRTAETEEQLEAVKRAVLGRRPASGGSAAGPTFGFLGDIGRLPDSLPQLLRPGGLPSFSVDPGRRLGAGWQGPYFEPGLLRDSVELRVDAFGRPLRYALKDTTVAGQAWDAFLQSAGADAEFATGDDVFVPILPRETTGTLVGTVLRPDGSPVSGQSVTVTFRRGGTLVDTTVTTGTGGRFGVAGLPQGRLQTRAAAGSGGSGPSGPGRIELVPGSPATEGPDANDLVFGVRNPGTSDVTIDDLTATFSGGGSSGARYDQVLVDGPGDPGAGDVVFDGAEFTFFGQVIVFGWAQSGETVPFDQTKTVPAGTGGGSGPTVTPSAVVTLDAPRVIADTLRLPPGAGGSGAPVVRIRLRDFWTVRPGFFGLPARDEPLDLSGVSFQIQFSSGDVVSFTVP